MRPFLCLVEVRLHFGESQDLKGKRKHLKSLKAQVRQRFGAAVMESEGHDTWQRSTLVIALLGEGDVGDRADELERFIDARFPGAASYSRTLRSLEDLTG